MIASPNWKKISWTKPPARINPATPTAIAVRVAAERAFLLRLEGGCQVPIAAHAVVRETTIDLAGLIASTDGKTILHETASGPVTQAAHLGTTLAQALLDRGGKTILDTIYREHGR